MVLRGLAALWVCLLPACSGAEHRCTDVVYPIEIPATPCGVDVIEHLARYPVGDGVLRAYAEELEGYVRKPRTVERLAAAYASTLNAKRRAALAYLLAASRNEKGLRAAGNALYDQDPGVGLAAATGIEVYWMEETVNGNSRRLGLEVLRWWNERKVSLEAHERSSR